MKNERNSLSFDIPTNKKNITAQEIDYKKLETIYLSIKIYMNLTVRLMRLAI